jgi:hypothetical protein
MAKLGRFRAVNWTALTTGLAFLGTACGSATTMDPGATGGAATSSGGLPSGAGGVLSTSGGAPSAGGVSTGSGGASTGLGGASTAGGTTGSVGGAGPTGGQSATGGDSGTGGGAAGDVYNPDFVEFYGEDCEVAEPADVNISGSLPDLFEKLDGTRMTKKSEWRCRRAEMKKVVEKYIHGPKPGAPEMVSGTVSATSISVTVTQGGNSISFSVSVSMPAGAARPAPIIIGAGGSNLRASILTAEGVATGNYNHNDLASETSRSGKFSQLYPGTSASAQTAWAWGISRVIDVLVAEKAAGRNDIIDPTAVGITGCSRNGKAAFTIGAMDERIALGIPQEPGTAGPAALRIVNTNPTGPNGGEVVQSIASVQSEAAGWFMGGFTGYQNKDNVNKFPGDMHSLVAMYAPRGLLILDNSRIGHLGASATHGSAAAARLVYEALGVGANMAYHGGNPGDPHDHCTFYDSQAEPLTRAIRAHLTRTAEPDGRMEPQPSGTADLAKWVPWTAPTLE